VPPAPAPPAPAPAPPAPPAPKAAGDVVVCPICLGDITDWNTQSPWEWEPTRGVYQELEIPPGLTELQRAPHLRHAYVRCTARRGSALQPDDQPHFLPANYGRFGRPAVLGFVGLSMAGKSHLLSAMVARIVAGDLRKGYQVTHDPLDHARHQVFLDSHVNPLLREGKVLPGTRETDVLEFADAFLMNDESGQRRPVAFFDIAGGDLASLRKKKATDFLYMADGLFFVVDPERLADRWVQDNTFSNVLNIIRERPRQESVSAAIVLTKADTLRFEEPIDRWLRYEPELEPLDATQFLRESADVYGYLESRNALALAAPYEKCAKATLHVVSATGGSGAEKNTVYARGVRPRRVMRPLAAMLAMTGVLTGPEADKVGI
jgi:Double-GTPase 2